MNAKERYDEIISLIEIMAEDPYASIYDIRDEILRKNCVDYRDISFVFHFMTGYSLRNYIRDRKLMASYRYLVSNKKFDVRSAYEIADYDNQQSYNRRFVKRFGMSPKKAFKAKNMDLYIPASTWAVISCDNDVHMEESSKMASVEKETAFGLSLQQYEVVSEVFELSAKYGFEKIFSQFAFAFAEKHNITITEAFRYTSSLRECGIGTVDDVDDEYVISPEEELLLWGYDQYYIRMFFEWGYSVSDAMSIEEKLCLSGDEILSLDKKMVEDFLVLDEEDVDFFLYETAYKYFNQKASETDSDADWDYYLQSVLNGNSKESAFEYSLDRDKAYYDDGIDLDEEYEAIEKWADEETIWNEDRFDMEYDADNLYYELTEDDTPAMKWRGDIHRVEDEIEELFYESIDDI